MYTLPNGRHIEVEDGVNAVLDGTEQNYYFLDVEKGDICCVSSGGLDSHSTIDKVRSSTNRYFEIPRVTQSDKEQWLRSFAEEIMYVEDAPLSKIILSLPKNNFFERALTEIKSADDNWIDGWEQWSRDSAYELFDEWLGTLPFDIKKEWDGCGNCALCKAQVEGNASFPELIKAFSEEEFMGKAEELIQPQKTQKALYTEAEHRFVSALKKCGMDTMFSVSTFKKWVTDEKKFSPFFASNALFALVPRDVSNADSTELIQASMQFANVIPRKVLDGKTPNEAVRERDRNEEPVVDSQFFSIDPYLDIWHRANEKMAQKKFPEAYDFFTEVIQHLLEDKVPLYDVFRVFANAGVCYGIDLDDYFGEELVDASLRINPLYDFGQRTKERIITEYDDFSHVTREYRKIAQGVRTIMKEKAHRKYKKSVFYKYEQFLKSAGV